MGNLSVWNSREVVLALNINLRVVNLQGGTKN